MSVVAIILPLALLVVAAAVAAYVWAARSGQFDDTDTPASRVLVDDVPARPVAAEPEPQAASRPGGVSGDSA
jgi:cbb3-type cytochrome oxidase maturation protein